jgi:hypothetical protein
VDQVIRRVPALVIRLGLEEPLRVLAVWEHEADERRFRDWLASHPELAELVARALSLAEEKAA